jgi:hypothetical protein
MLTPKQQRFVSEYLIDLNGTQAAIRAGYSLEPCYRPLGYYVYLLIANSRIVYVGKGIRNRWRAHLRQKSHSCLVNLRVQAGGVRAFLFADALSEDEALKIERSLIQSLPDLLNQSDGALSFQERQQINCKLLIRKMKRASSVPLHLREIHKAILRECGRLIHSPEPQWLVSGMKLPEQSNASRR